jgi:hypothetical protein
MVRSESWVRTAELKAGNAYIDLDGNILVYIGRTTKRKKDTSKYVFYIGGKVVIQGEEWNQSLRLYGGQGGAKIAIATAKEFLKLPYTYDGVLIKYSLSGDVWGRLGEVCTEEFIKRYLTQGKLAGKQIPDVQIGVSTLVKVRGEKDEKQINSRDLEIGKWYISKENVLKFAETGKKRFANPIMFLGRTESGSYVWLQHYKYNGSSDTIIDLSTAKSQTMMAYGNVYDTKSNLRLYDLHELEKVGATVHESYYKKIELTEELIELVELTTGRMKR